MEEGKNWGEVPTSLLKPPWHRKLALLCHLLNGRFFVYISYLRQTTTSIPARLHKRVCAIAIRWTNLIAIVLKEVHSELCKLDYEAGPRYFCLLLLKQICISSLYCKNTQAMTGSILYTSQTSTYSSSSAVYEQKYVCWAWLEVLLWFSKQVSDVTSHNAPTRKSAEENMFRYPTAAYGAFFSR